MLTTSLHYALVGYVKYNICKRMTPESLLELLMIDQEAWDRSPPRSIILFDDVLTTGKHFKACERRLREIDPTISIAGIFVARRALPRHIDDFENLDPI